MTNRPGTCSLILLLALAAASPAVRAQGVIQLSPKTITSLPCAELMANVDVEQGDIATAMKLAAAGGYRHGYVMGYLHGALDVDGKKKPLTKDELETFFGTYELVCKDDPKLSIYAAARRAMSFQSR